MHMNNDISNKLNIQGCDPDKEEGQRTANQNTKELILAGTALGVNRLYNKYGDDYKETIEMPMYLWAFRCIDTGIIPEFDEAYPDFDSIYARMKNEGWTEEEIDKVKNLPNAFIKQVKQGCETVLIEGDGFVDGKYVKPYSFFKWVVDKTKPAPVDAVTFWNDYTVTNTWKLTHNDSEEAGDIYEDKTEEEMKEIVSTIAKDFFGDVLESTNTIPVDFDEKGGMIFNKTSLSEGTDEDTYMVTDGYGDEHIVDGKEKATEKATEFVNEKMEIQFGIRIERKITEPDGYFAWREENIADYL